MTYSRFKALVNALLIGDNKLTKNDEELKALLEYAFVSVANEADALKLMNANGNDDLIIRSGIGGTFVRMPRIPENDDDELDIDEILVFAVARYVASFVSKNKIRIHIDEARKIINNYNNNITTMLEKLDQNGALDMYGKDDKIGKVLVTE